MRLNDKVAIVTGSARGIGRGIALCLAREGASIVVADINFEGAQSVAREIKAMGFKSLPLKVDASQNKEVKEMVEVSLKQFEKVDILVNNVGGIGDLTKAPIYFNESSEESWDYIIGRNLKSVLNCTRAVINQMIERRSGKIINIASITGVVGEVKQSIYSATKAGVIGFTKALAKEVGPYGINVNSISPGFTRTPATEPVLKYDMETRGMQIPLRRAGEPEDIGNAVVFLASEEGSYITGQNLCVCGGLVVT